MRKAERFILSKSGKIHVALTDIMGIIVLIDRYHVHMYIRRVQRKNIGGSTVTYLQIAENVWDSEHRRSKVQILCTLGRADREAEDRLQQLVRSIRKNAMESPGLLEPGWTFENSWEHGPLYVVAKLWESLEIGKIIAESAQDEERSVPFERAVLAMVANAASLPAPSSAVTSAG
jgi:hypothetical protein